MITARCSSFGDDTEDMTSLLELGHIEFDFENIMLPQRSSHGSRNAQNPHPQPSCALRFAEIKHSDAVEAQGSEQACESPSASRVCCEVDICFVRMRPVVSESLRRAASAAPTLVLRVCSAERCRARLELASEGRRNKRCSEPSRFGEPKQFEAPQGRA